MVSTPVTKDGVTIHVPINPFFHRTNWSWVQKIKVSILCVTVFPIRLIFMLFFMGLACLLAMIGTIYIPTEAKPLSLWRRVFRWIIAKVIIRLYFFSCGFYWINVKGRQASRNEAPILVMAPHSSLADAMPLALTGGPSIVLKSDVYHNNFFRKMLELTQPIYVSRELDASRAETAREIISRSKSEFNWPQIYIYPEGTTTNRSCLITFNKGAFNPGVPIQPVIIKYPNHNDTITWTFDSLTMWEFYYLSASQFFLRCDIEFLPVYYPNDDEKSNSILFARNVRKLMAEKMGVPVLDYTFQDGVLMQRMIKKDELSNKFKMLSKLREKLRITSYMELDISKRAYTTPSNSEKTTQEFIDEFHLQGANPILITKLFALFDKRNIGKIDIREYFVYATLLNHGLGMDKILPTLFIMYGYGQRVMSKDGFKRLMQGVFGMTEDNANTYFHREMDANALTITAGEFDGKIRKCLEYLYLYALEATGVFSVYPIQGKELR